MGVFLDDEQKAIVTAVQHNRRVSVRSGTARGKDFVAAVIAMCFLYLTPRWNDNGELVEKKIKISKRIQYSGAEKVSVTTAFALRV